MKDIGKMERLLKLLTKKVGWSCPNESKIDTRINEGYNNHTISTLTKSSLIIHIKVTVLSFYTENYAFFHTILNIWKS